MYFVFSDVHGCLVEMDELLTHWDKERETLIFLGDMIDRGKDSFGVVKRLMELKQKYPNKVIVLKGNHDDQFMQWLHLSQEERQRYYYHDLHDTLKSFYSEDPKRFGKDTRQQRAVYVKRKYPEMIQFMRNLPLYHETDTCIFVHAGLDLNNPNWRTDKDNLLWIRKEFYFNKEKSNKRIFFGHTPTQLIYETKRNDIWMSKHGDKIGIDGACVFGGQLNGIKIDSVTSSIVDIIKIKKEKSLQKTS